MTKKNTKNISLANELKSRKIKMDDFYGIDYLGKGIYGLFKCIFDHEKNKIVKTKSVITHDSPRELMNSARELGVTQDKIYCTDLILAIALIEVADMSAKNVIKIKEVDEQIKEREKHTL